MPVPRYLITGGDGFIGFHLVRRLASRGETTVVIRPGCELSRLQAIQKDIQKRYLDVRDGEKVRQVIGEVRPTIIFHLAAAGMIPGKEPADDIMMGNVVGAYNILSGIVETGTAIERAVFVGSWYEYGKALVTGLRRFPLPTSVYGLSKLASTLLVQSFASTLDIPAMVVRPFQVYGPMEHTHRLIPQIVQSALDQIPLRLRNPRSLRDWIYVEDVAAALDFAAGSTCHGDVVDIGTGIGTSVADVARMVFQLTGIDREPLDDPSSDGPARNPRASDESLSGVADTRPAEVMFAWKAEHSLKEGLRKTVEWYLEQRR